MSQLVTIALPQDTWQIVEDALVSLHSDIPEITQAISAMKGM